MIRERGLTLIEVLATLTLLSIVGIMIWSVFFQGYGYSQKSISKNMMIQEANIISSNLIKIHQTSDNYELTSTNSNCGITVTFMKQNIQQTQAFENSQLCLSYELKNNISGKVDPNITDVPLILTISDKKSPNNKISLESTLYRMKGDSD